MGERAPMYAGRLIPWSAVGVFALGAYAVLAYPAHHDVAWLLYVAGQVLDGSALYSDIVEVNPPLIIWISVLAETAARLTGAWDVLTYRLLVLGIAALSILLTRRQAIRLANPATADLLTLVLAYLFVAGTGFEFGQREHLAIVLVFPFLLLVARQIERPGASRFDDVTAAALAGVGFVLKPHFLLALAAVELYVLFRRRRVLPSLPHAALALVIGLYGISILVLEPDYLALARLAAGAYTHMSQSSPVALLTLGPALWSLAAVLVGFITPRQAPSRELCRVFSIAAAGFLLVVIAQSKGWGYHWIPTLTISAALITLVLAAWLSVLIDRNRLARAGTAGSIAVAVLLIALTVRHLSDAGAQRARMQGKAFLLPQMIDVVERYAAGGPIAVLSTNMQAAFPLVNYTDAVWALRFNSLWLLPGAYPEYVPGSRIQYHPVDRMPAAERYMFDAVIADLTRSRPNVLMVDRLPPGYVLQGFDYLTYFGRDARFAALMHAYREIGAVERYRIFVRT